MGKMILVEGQPGTGKTAAIRNLDPETTLIVKPNNKDLPFKGSRNIYKKGVNSVNVSSFREVREVLTKVNSGTKFQVVVVEDITHIFSRRVMGEASEKGYEKWTRLAVDAFDGLLEIEGSLRDDLYVIVIGHTQMHKDFDGNQTFVLQTPGALLDSIIKIPSYFTYVLHSGVEDLEDGSQSYYFLTNRDGSGKEAKSPEGCLDIKEPNDYRRIIDKIEAYQNGD